MDWIFIFGLLIVCVMLWQRLGAMERRVDSLEEFISSRSPSAPPPPPPPVEPVRVIPTTRTVPRTAPAKEAEPEAEPVPQAEVFPEPVAKTRPATQEAIASAPLPPSQPPAPPQPEPEPEQEPEPETEFARSFDFEDIFGRRLPIWAGGFALAIGGIFLVRYSIEAGLLGPEVRVALSFVFGLVLLALAEGAYRFAERVGDERVRQAFAGAGIATLYAAFYLAGAMYGLIGPGVAFGGLALVTALALGLAFRFGLPTAILGLVGGFVTPLMVESEKANVPVLAVYLALLTAALALTAKRLGYAWLALSALGGGFLWGVLMLLGDLVATGDRLAVGLYLVTLGAAVPLLIERDAYHALARVAAGAVGAAQLAALVALAGFDLLTWGLYLLLAAALAVLSWREKALQPANALALALGVILLATWGSPPVGEFIAVAAALTTIGLGLPLALMWQGHGEVLHSAQLSLGALALGAVGHWQFGSGDNSIAIPGLAAGLALLAALAALGAWKSWRVESALDSLLALPVAVSGLLAFAALHTVLPDWAEVTGAAAVALVLAELIRRNRRKTLAGVAWGGAAIVLVALLSTGKALTELTLAVGGDYGTPDTLRALVRWSVAGLPFLALALVEWRRRVKRLAESIGAIILYVLAAQVIPGEALAWTLALGAMAAIWFLTHRSGAWLTLLALGGLWASPHVFLWMAGGAEAFVALPMFVSDVPALNDAARFALPFVIAASFASWRCLAMERDHLGRGLAMVAGFAGIIVLHTAYKQLFGIDSAEAFAQSGMAERTLWQALLTSAGVALLHFRPQCRLLALCLTGSGFAHFAWFTFALHNPLWSTQATGALPLANWLLPAYAIAIVAVWWLTRQSRGSIDEGLRQIGDAVVMVLISFWGLSELRHAFAGNVLTATGMTQTEDLLRSLLGIVLAIGFLVWGSRSGQRNWRIGSLVLMLLAVCKVFLFDVAGLGEVLRIISFVALGLSLIGIGWFYARQLRPSRKEPPA